MIYWIVLGVLTAVGFVMAAYPVRVYGTVNLVEIVWVVLSLVGVGANSLQAVQASNDIDFMLRNAINGELLRGAKGRRRAAISEAVAKGWLGLAGAVSMTIPNGVVTNWQSILIVGGLVAGVVVLSTRTVDRVIERWREIGSLRF